MPIIAVARMTTRIWTPIIKITSIPSLSRDTVMPMETPKGHSHPTDIGKPVGNIGIPKPHEKHGKDKQGEKPILKALINKAFKIDATKVKGFPQRVPKRLLEWVKEGIHWEGATAESDAKQRI
jgi:hypothetical protein